MKQLTSLIKANIISKITNKQVFIIIDESSTNNKYYLNILIGDIAKPNLTYLIECKVFNCPMTNEIITREIDELILSLGIPRMDFVLIISDAASYLVKSYKTLKILFPQLFHYTCMSHLVHNCCLRIKDYFKLTDELIATTKTLTNKNKTRCLVFASIGIPPTPVITRWGTWLKAVEYYYNNFNQVKSIILGIESEGKILSDWKRAIQNNDLEAELQIIKKCYIPLITVIEDLIEKRYTITQSYHLLKNFDFKEDPIMIKTYLLKRLDAHGINDVFKKENTLGFLFI